MHISTELIALHVTYFPNNKLSVTNAQAVSAEQQQRIAGALVDTLTDKDTGVGCDAAAALQQYGSTETGMLSLLPLCCHVILLVF